MSDDEVEELNDENDKYVLLFKGQKKGANLIKIEEKEKWTTKIKRLETNPKSKRQAEKEIERHADAVESAKKK